MIDRLKARMTEILLMMILAVLLYAQFAPVPMTHARAFVSHATGGTVYCRTGSLPATTHEDNGTATVPTSWVVDCP